MRTTLTLEPDVAAQLQRRLKSGKKMKTEVNRLLRLGLEEDSKKPAPRRPYRTQTIKVGGLKIADVDDIADVLAQIEGESYK